jgi:hypothetical protein
MLHGCACGRSDARERCIVGGARLSMWCTSSLPNCREETATQARTRCVICTFPPHLTGMDGLEPAHICTGIAPSHFSSHQASTPSPQSSASVAHLAGAHPKASPRLRDLGPHTEDRGAGRQGRHRGRKQCRGWSQATGCSRSEVLVLLAEGQNAIPAIARASLEDHMMRSDGDETPLCAPTCAPTFVCPPSRRVFSLFRNVRTQNPKTGTKRGT